MHQVPGGMVGARCCEPRAEHRLQIGSLVGTQFGKVAAFARQLNIIHHFSVDGREITAMALENKVEIDG